MNPLFSSEIITILGIDPNSLDNAYLYNRFQSILKYFESRDNANNEILSILSNKSGNPLDIMWTYVQLQKAKQAELQKFSPDDVAPDIAEEIVQGYLTLAKKERIRKSVVAMKAGRDRKYKTEQEAAKAAELATKTEQTLNMIDELDKELAFY